MEEEDPETRVSDRASPFSLLCFAEALEVLPFVSLADSEVSEAPDEVVAAPLPFVLSLTFALVARGSLSHVKRSVRSVVLRFIIPRSFERVI